MSDRLAIAVLNDSSLARLATALMERTLPRSLMELLCGPGQVLRISSQAEMTARPKHRGRPVDVVLDDSAILFATIRAPKMARRDLRRFVSLYLERHLPFAPAELIVLLKATRLSDRPGEVDIRIAVASRALLEQALQLAGVGTAKVRSLGSEGMTWFERVRMAVALSSPWSVRKAIAFGPIALIVVALALSVVGDLQSRARLDSHLRGQIAMIEADIAAFQTALATRDVPTINMSALASSSGTPYSTFELLNALRNGRPSTLTIDTVSYDAPSLAVNVRSPNIMSDLSYLQSSLSDWNIALAGGIDSSGDLEAALFRLDQLP